MKNVKDYLSFSLSWMNNCNGSSTLIEFASSFSPLPPENPQQRIVRPNQQLANSFSATLPAAPRSSQPSKRPKRAIDFITFMTIYNRPYHPTPSSFIMIISETWITQT
jgi:hypothetical protein